MSSLATETIVRLPDLHEAQAQVERGRSRFNVLACGRRWGKTKYLTRRMGLRLLSGQNYGYFAATYKLIHEVWDELQSRLGHVASFHKSERRIKGPTGGLIECWTLEDEDAGRSRRYHEVGIDEAGLVANLQKKWFEAIRPTLTDFQGQADFAGTPKGRNFFHTAFMFGQDAENREWRSWQMPTATNSRLQGLDSELAAARAGMPDRSFRQEYLAEFIEDSGGVFRMVGLAVDEGRSECEPRLEGHAYTMGVDLARIEDFTVLTVLDASGKQVYHERFNQISWERQKQAISVVASKYRPGDIWLDSTGVGDPIFEDLRKAGLPVRGYQFTNASKEALIDNLAMKIESGGVRLMDLPVQTNELLAYQYELTPSRNVRMNAPAGMHDDCVVSLALASWGLANQASGWGGVFSA